MTEEAARPALEALPEAAADHLAAAAALTPEQRTIEAQRQTLLTLQSVIASQAVEIHSLRGALASTAAAAPTTD
jgi:hypothetical protein